VLALVVRAAPRVEIDDQEPPFEDVRVAGEGEPARDVQDGVESLRCDVGSIGFGTKYTPAAWRESARACRAMSKRCAPVVPAREGAAPRADVKGAEFGDGGGVDEQGELLGDFGGGHIEDPTNRACRPFTA
jgi:hypothetical protein